MFGGLLEYSPLPLYMMSQQLISVYVGFKQSKERCVIGIRVLINKTGSIHLTHPVLKHTWTGVHNRSFYRGAKMAASVSIVGPLRSTCTPQPLIKEQHLHVV